MKKLLTLIMLLMLPEVSLVGGEMPISKETKDKVRDCLVKGHAAMAFGNYDDAINWYKKTLELDPNLADAHCFIGDVYVKKDLLDNALSEYKKAIAIQPNALTAHIGLGDIYGKRGRLEEAMAEYKKVIAIKPDSAPAHAGLGDIYFKKSKIDEALAEYKEALSANPDYAPAHLSLGLIYRNKGLAAVAAHHLYNAGTLFFAQGNREGALQAYENLKHTNSKDLEKSLREKLYPEVK